jgi:hypothetical protein
MLLGSADSVLNDPNGRDTPHGRPYSEEAVTVESHRIVKMNTIVSASGRAVTSYGTAIAEVGHRAAEHHNTPISRYGFTASSCLSRNAAIDSVADSLRPVHPNLTRFFPGQELMKLCCGEEPSPDLPASWLGTVSRLEVEKHLTNAGSSSR